MEPPPPSCSDLLFEQLYSRLVENTVAKGVFLESLESYIVADRLGHLTTPIMRDLLAHYHSSGMMDSLERCIVHLDITSLDIQQVCLPACVCVNWTNRHCKKCVCLGSRLCRCVGRINSMTQWFTSSTEA